MQQTSLLAYAEVRPKLNERQARVLEIVEEYGPVSNKEIARHIGWEINSVTPRCLELRQKGKVESAYVAKDLSGRRVNFWRVVA